jgi:uncharacterized protein (DUF433 family)
MSPQVEQILQEIDRLTPAEQAQVLYYLSQPLKSTSNIQKTPGVVGGDACIGNTRIPVWELVEYRQLGATTSKILEAYPQLTEIDLQAAWDYHHSFSAEIAAAIAANEAA